MHSRHVLHQKQPGPEFKSGGHHVLEKEVALVSNRMIAALVSFDRKPTIENPWQGAAPASTSRVRRPASRRSVPRQGADVMDDHAVVANAGVVETVGPGGHLVHIDGAEYLEAGPDEALGGASRTREEIDDSGGVETGDPGGCLPAVMLAECPQLALVAEWRDASADGPPVLDQVDVERVA